MSNSKHRLMMAARYMVAGLEETLNDIPDGVFDVMSGYDTEAETADGEFLIKISFERIGDTK